MRLNSAVYLLCLIPQILCAPQIGLKKKNQECSLLLDEYNLDISRVGNSTTSSSSGGEIIQTATTTTTTRNGGDWISILRLLKSGGGAQQQQDDAELVYAMSGFTGFSVILNHFYHHQQQQQEKQDKDDIFASDDEFSSENISFKSNLIDAMEINSNIYNKYCMNSNPLTGICSNVQRGQDQEENNNNHQEIWNLMHQAIKLIPPQLTQSLKNIEIGYIYSTRIAHIILHLNNNKKLVIYGASNDNAISICLSSLSSIIKNLVELTKTSSSNGAKLDIIEKLNKPKNHGEERYGLVRRHLLTAFIEFH